AGAAGGVVGAWLGVLVYWLAVLPDIHDPLIFSACVLAGFLLGGILLAFLFAGPPDLARAQPFKPASRVVGGVLGAIVGLLLGAGFAYLSIVPGSAAGLESLGYFVDALLGMVIGAAFGLIVSGTAPN